jgi:hypothetical protein
MPGVVDLFTDDAARSHGNVCAWISLSDPTKLDKIKICAMQTHYMHGKEAYEGLWG